MDDPATNRSAMDDPARDGSAIEDPATDGSTTIETGRWRSRRHGDRRDLREARRRLTVRRLALGASAIVDAAEFW